MFASPTAHVKEEVASIWSPFDSWVVRGDAVPISRVTTGGQSHIARLVGAFRDLAHATTTRERATYYNCDQRKRTKHEKAREKRPVQHDAICKPRRKGLVWKASCEHVVCVCFCYYASAPRSHYVVQIVSGERFGSTNKTNISK